MKLYAIRKFEKNNLKTYYVTPERDLTNTPADAILFRTTNECRKAIKEKLKGDNTYRPVMVIVNGNIGSIGIWKDKEEKKTNKATSLTDFALKTGIAYNTLYKYRKGVKVSQTTKNKIEEGKVKYDYNFGDIKKRPRKEQPKPKPVVEKEQKKDMIEPKHYPKKGKDLISEWRLRYDDKTFSCVMMSSIERYGHRHLDKNKHEDLDKLIEYAIRMKEEIYGDVGKKWR